jgi:hypothetical protein
MLGLCEGWSGLAGGRRAGFQPSVVRRLRARAGAVGISSTRRRVERQLDREAQVRSVLRRISIEEDMDRWLLAAGDVGEVLGVAKSRVSDGRAGRPHADAGSRSAGGNTGGRISRPKPGSESALRLRRAPRLALTRQAAAALGMSIKSFERHIQPELRLVRRGELRLIPVREIERWLEDNSDLALEQLGP